MSFGFKVKDLHNSSVKAYGSWWCYLTIALLVTAAYVPSFTGEFILDDNPLIKNNPYIRSIHSITSYVSQEDGIIDRDFQGSNYHTGYYRPLINFTYGIDYKLWGVSAPGFRTTNLILHLLACFLLFQLLVLLVDDRQTAFWTVILFALHPVNTEAVSWAASRNNILVTLFAICSLYFYIKGWQKGSYAALALSVLFFAGAIFSKEFGLMVLPMLFLYHRFFSNESRDTLKELRTYIPFILIVASYFILRESATGSFVTPSGIDDFWSRAYFSPYIILLNLRLIFFPYGLHSFVIHYPNTYLDLQALAGFLLLFVLGFLIGKHRKDKLIGFSVLAFLVALFPILNIIDTSAVTLISMRWLYFPMAFLFLAMSRCLQKFREINRLALMAVLVLVGVYLGVYSYVLNRNLWHNEGTFFQQEVLRFDNHVYAGGFAECLLEKKEYREAERYFLMAIKHHPDQAKNFINYSALLVETGRPEAAMTILNKAIALTMTHNVRGEWFNNLGMAYFKLRKPEQALECFLEAVRFCPTEARFWANLGGAYGTMGDYDNSVAALGKGLEVRPDSSQLRKNLAVTYMKMEDYEKALVILEEIPFEEVAGNKEIMALLDKARHNLSIKEEDPT